ncbi:hypothetical protein PUNSTDRAFT_154813 [Punctularia strigosozonata HHB-11173 SS5]|uniref:uncharacterized protein n=1 Tax=Punctularia strigosozonata (strain HHB-11173) TaxID=741275 RepID=UPI0004417C33|nr:uncharacterized protein PUNSTDRAFT_154813 [Punctularia strigosozonata HHB-11173 SS5]EIN07542.1 hypothetical protein PUNSTDRAFT_154813 [Punctularia strigosozonata HHB-11173 SS5]
MVPAVLCMLSALFIPLLASAQSAWHGEVTPGSRRLTTFTPYFVPEGCKSYDSASPLVHYSGLWLNTYSASYIANTLRQTHKAEASCSFMFRGTGVEWFGNIGQTHGTHDVYVDGQLVQTVDTYSDVARKQQRLFWKFGLEDRTHMLKIVNTGSKHELSAGTTMTVDAFVVTQGAQSRPPNLGTYTAETLPPDASRFKSLAAAPAWELVQKGSTGVHAMQLSIISSTHALIVDKVEHNPLTVEGHPAWAALYNLDTHAVKPLSLQSNSFCAGGSFLGNGTLINVGGNPIVEDHTGAADFGDANGLQAIRVFEPCESPDAEGCAMTEDHQRIRMASARWYASTVRLDDGSVMIIGGSTKGGWMNNATTNNPTVEYFPPKSINGSKGLPVHMPFLVDTLNSNLFPIAILLPSGRVFVAANQDTMIYDWKTATEQRLPSLPNGVRVTYPMTGTATLLPLTYENGFVPEVLICGGSTIDDRRPGSEISSQEAASDLCFRMVLDDAGISAGWQSEKMPQARVMPDAVLMPTGQVVIVNGAGTGISGYGNVVNQVGQSNADNPVLSPVLYDPSAPSGTRFSTQGMPTSAIPRLYHSIATYTPNGDIMIAGSNPNLDRSEVDYGTEYRVEWLRPPYMGGERPEIVGGVPNTLMYGEGNGASLQVNVPQSMGVERAVALMDLGFVTHAIHASSRMVRLQATMRPGNSSSQVRQIDISNPPHNGIYPPGPGWLYVVVDGVPSKGVKVMVGDGTDPPFDAEALENLLKSTKDEEVKGKGHDSDVAE